LTAKVNLGENICGGGVGLEDANAVVLIEKKVQVAGAVGLDGVELSLAGAGEQAGEGEAGSLRDATGQEHCYEERADGESAKPLSCDETGSGSGA